MNYKYYIFSFFQGIFILFSMQFGIQVGSLVENPSNINFSLLGPFFFGIIIYFLFEIFNVALNMEMFDNV